MKDIRHEGFFEKNDLNGGDDLRQFDDLTSRD